MCKSCHIALINRCHLRDTHVHDVMGASDRKLVIYPTEYQLSVSCVSAGSDMGRPAYGGGIFLIKTPGNTGNRLLGALCVQELYTCTLDAWKRCALDIHPIA